MSKIKNLLVIMGGISFMMCAQAQNKDPNAYALMTTRDMSKLDLSNITIINRTGQLITSYGLFIASYDTNDCSACTGNILAGDNAAGAMAAPVTFKPNQAIAIGQNYLYNMIYNGIYFLKTNSSSPCSLPGCSWPGDDPSAVGTGWCITINAVSRDSNYTYSNYTNGSNPPANFPMYAAAGNSSGNDYQYSLIDPSTLGSGNACLGPITCDDQTLTCKVATAQSESFQPYSRRRK